jgi:hypothetical protein
MIARIIKTVMDNGWFVISDIDKANTDKVVLVEVKKE